MTGAIQELLSRNTGTRHGAILPFMLIMALVFSEIAFTLLAWTGQERVRGMSEAAQERMIQWSSVMTKAAYILNFQRLSASTRSASASQDVVTASINQLRFSLDRAQAADKAFFDSKPYKIQEIAIKLFGEGAMTNIASYHVRGDVVRLLREMVSEPDLILPLATGASTSTLFEIHSRQALAPVIRAQEDLSKLMARSVYVVGFAIVTANILANLGIWSIWRYMMRPGLFALEGALSSKAHSELQLRAILQSIGDAIIATDQHRKIIEINDEAQVLTGWSETAARNQRLEDVLHLVDRDLKSLIEEVDLASAEYDWKIKRISRATLKSREQIKYQIALTVAAVHEHDGHFDGLVLAFRDISDEIVMRDMMIHREKANMLEKLAGTVAHDFNNLLAVILGNASLIVGSPNLNVMQEGAVQAVLRSGRAGAELAAQLLSLARPRLGRPERLMLDDVIANVVAMAQLVLTGGRTIEIGSRSQAAVFVDAAALRIAILNILMNSIEATKNNGRIEILCSRDAASPDYVTIELRDDGCGIPPELLARVQKPFFTTKAEIKGTGLGLSSATEFVEHAGGRLRIESEVDRGTSVFLILPVSEEIGAGEGASRALKADRSETVMNILVLDDDKLRAEALREQIVAAGHRARAASRAPEAAEMQADSFDIVICDLQFAGATGYAAQDNFTRSLGRSCPPFLFITGNAPAPHLDQLAQSGHHRILRKPFDVADLLQAAQDVIRRSRVQDHDVASSPALS